MGTESGLFKIDKSNTSITPTSVRIPISRIFVNPTYPVILAVSKKSIYTIAPDKKDPFNYNATKVFSIKPNESKEERIISVQAIGEKLMVCITSHHIYIKPLKYKGTPVRMLTFPIENDLFSMFVDQTANIWIGGQQGLLKIKRQNIDVNYIDLTSFDQLGNYKLNDIFYDQGNLLLATSNSGVYIYNRNEKFRKLKLPVNGMDDHWVKRR